MPENKTMAHLDWLRYSIPLAYPHDAMKSIALSLPPYKEIQLTEETLPNPRGYDHCRKLTVGRVAWHSERPEQKLGYEFTGKDMQAIDAANIPVRLLMAHAMTKRANVTRLDFAVDLFNTGGKVSDLAQAWEAGELKSPLRRQADYVSKERLPIGVTRAQTFYLGSPQSERQLRVYDKAAEQGIEADWLRIELVTRDKRAQALAADMITHGVVDAGRQAVRKTMNGGVDWYMQALEGRIVELTPVTRPDTDTVNWLLSQVLPVLKREVTKELMAGRPLLYSKFVGVLRDAYEQHR